MTKKYRLPKKIFFVIFIDMKVCKVCDKKKKLESFAKNNQYKDGYLATCKICHSLKLKKKKEEETEGFPFVSNMRLQSTTKEDWCKMFSLLQEMGYNVEADIHEQFISKYNLPAKKKPTEKIAIYKYIDCY